MYKHQINIFNKKKNDRINNNGGWINQAFLPIDRALLINEGYSKKTFSLIDTRYYVGQQTRQDDDPARIPCPKYVKYLSFVFLGHVFHILLLAYFS